MSTSFKFLKTRLWIEVFNLSSEPASQHVFKLAGGKKIDATIQLVGLHVGYGKESDNHYVLGVCTGAAEGIQ